MHKSTAQLHGASSVLETVYRACPVLCYVYYIIVYHCITKHYVMLYYMKCFCTIKVYYFTSIVDCIAFLLDIKSYHIVSYHAIYACLHPFPARLLTVSFRHI